MSFDLQNRRINREVLAGKPGFREIPPVPRIDNSAFCTTCNAQTQVQEVLQLVLPWSGYFVPSVGRLNQTCYPWIITIDSHSSCSQSISHSLDLLILVILWGRTAGIIPVYKWGMTERETEWSDNKASAWIWISFFLTTESLFSTLPYVLINDTTGTRYLNKLFTEL